MNHRMHHLISIHECNISELNGNLSWSPVDERTQKAAREHLENIRAALFSKFSTKINDNMVIFTIIKEIKKDSNSLQLSLIAQTRNMNMPQKTWLNIMQECESMIQSSLDAVADLADSPNIDSIEVKIKNLAQQNLLDTDSSIKTKELAVSNNTEARILKSFLKFSRNLPERATQCDLNGVTLTIPRLANSTPEIVSAETITHIAYVNGMIWSDTHVKLSKATCNDFLIPRDRTVTYEESIKCELLDLERNNSGKPVKLKLVVETDNLNNRRISHVADIVEVIENNLSSDKFDDLFIDDE
ncbi:hypothetical protein [Alteromonas facilis]|uniref:hypothetical protein n=1 Tax=Alteromonas facilis TaxID=2048004 RepID=UPI000C2867A7|nr:hypothetical protein [Alteromonas facilis]